MATLKDAVVDELLQNSSMTRREAHSWGDALSFHHQWMVLSREHAAALVHHRRDIIKVGVPLMSHRKVQTVWPACHTALQDTSACPSFLLSSSWNLCCLIGSAHVQQLVVW